MLVLIYLSLQPLLQHTSAYHPQSARRYLVIIEPTKQPLDTHFSYRVCPRFLLLGVVTILLFRYLSRWLAAFALVTT